MADPFPHRPNGPACPPRAFGPDPVADLLAQARTHETLVTRLAEQADLLDPDRAIPGLRPLMRMIWVHRIEALRLRGWAACAAASGARG